MAGFVALLYEDRDLMIGHCCVGALVVLIWWAIFAALVAGRSAAVRDIEGEACYEILRYLPATFFKASGSGSSSSARDSPMTPPPSPARLALRRRGPRQLALGCGKYDGYEPGPTAAPTAPQHWDAASSSYVDASGASGVGELSTVVCADKKGVAYAWEANMRGERDGAAGVPVALYGCLNRACCVSLGSVLGEWRFRARASAARGRG